MATTADELDCETPQERAIRERLRIALGNILDVKDRVEMSEADHRRLRGVVLRELNEFADVACALLRASAGGQVLNELYVEMLREVHDAVVPKT